MLYFKLLLALVVFTSLIAGQAYKELLEVLEIYKELYRQCDKLVEYRQECRNYVSVMEMFILETPVIPDEHIPYIPYLNCSFTK